MNDSSGDPPNNQEEKPIEAQVSKAESPLQLKRVGRFRLIELIGKGAMGMVLRAEDVTLKRQVALKMLTHKADKPDDKKTYKIEQFIREARAAANLDHPNVIHIYEVGEAQGWYYVAMELLEGGDLSQLVKAGGPLEIAQACQWVAEAAEGVAFAHKAGIIHRDIKPANLMLTRSGRCKVMDFGLARMDDPNDPFDLPVPTVGTPRYWAPEQAAGEPASIASDIYSLGATLYYVLCGKTPHTGKTVKELLQNIRNIEPPPMNEYRQDLPQGLIRVVERALDKDPARRFDKASDFAKALRPFAVAMSDASSIATALAQMDNSRASAASPGDHATQRSRLPFIIVAAATIIVLIAMGVTVLMLSGNADDPSEPQSPTTQSRPDPGDAIDWAGMTPLKQFEATQREALLEQAAQDSEGIYAVAGVVRYVNISDTGKVAQIYFEDARERDDFRLIVFNDEFAEMQEAFGGPAGENLEGRFIVAKGKLSIFKGNPQLIIDTARQILVD